MNRVEIIKASGEKDTFKIEKLTASLRKAGASSSLAGEIAQSINKPSMMVFPPKKYTSRLLLCCGSSPDPQQPDTNSKKLLWN
ncbi:MAG: hypothetical protein R2806_24515 [Saprospiraceae bacterium]